MKSTLQAAKKLTIYFLATTMLWLFVVNGRAEHSFQQRHSVVAGANLSAVSGKVDLTVTFHSIADDSEIVDGDKITWTNLESLFTSDAKWLAASTYAKVVSKMSIRGSAIQIYTDNTNKLEAETDLAVPAYDVDRTLKTYGIDSSTVGLYPVYLDNGIATAVGPALPLAWRVAPDKISGDDLKPITKLEGPVGHLQMANGPDGYYPWLYTADLAQKFEKNSGDMGNYSKIERAGIGLQLSENAFFADSDSTHFLYFAADFTKAMGQTSYKANIIIEAFIE